MSDASIIQSFSQHSHQTKSDPVVEVWYQFSSKIVISDSGGLLYTSYFWVKNKLPIPIRLNSVQITTGETPTEPVVDTAMLVPGTSSWSDSITFNDLGVIGHDQWTRRYQFSYKIRLFSI